MIVRLRRTMKELKPKLYQRSRVHDKLGYASPITQLHNLSDQGLVVGAPDDLIETVHDLGYRMQQLD